MVQRAGLSEKKLFFKLFCSPFTLIFLVLAGCQHTGQKEYLAVSLEYFFHELNIKDSIEMKALMAPKLQKVSKWIQKNDTSDRLTTEIHQAARRIFLLALSRPNHDNNTLKLIQYLKKKTAFHVNYYKILMELAIQSSSALKNKERDPMERATYLYVLDNILLDIEQSIQKHSKESHAILTYIIEEEIEIPDSVHMQRYMRILEPKSLSPSISARYIIAKQKGLDDEF